LPQPAEPSAAQKSAGTYAKDHKRVRGLRVSIENTAGSTRKGTDRSGNEWAVDMKHDYGYIRDTTGKDKDHLDVFLGPEPQADHPVFIVNQVNPDEGEFDEHKVMLGFKDEDSALDAYHSNYEPGWKGADTVAAMPFKAFRDWAFDGEKTTPAKTPKGYQVGGLVTRATNLAEMLTKAKLMRADGTIPAAAGEELSAALRMEKSLNTYTPPKVEVPRDFETRKNILVKLNALHDPATYKGLAPLPERYGRADLTDPSARVAFNDTLVKSKLSDLRSKGTDYDIERYLQGPRPTHVDEGKLLVTGFSGPTDLARKPLWAFPVDQPYAIPEASEYARQAGRDPRLQLNVAGSSNRPRYTAEFDSAVSLPSDLKGFRAGLKENFWLDNPSGQRFGRSPNGYELDFVDNASPLNSPERQLQVFHPNAPKARAEGALQLVAPPEFFSARRKAYAYGGSIGLAPLQGLGGTMYETSAPVRAAPQNTPLTFGGTAALLGLPGSYNDSDTSTSGSSGSPSTGGGFSIGTALGLAGGLTGNADLGLLGGGINAVSGLANGQVGPAAGLLGGLAGVPGAGAVAGLAGGLVDGTANGRTVGNAILGLGVPGYGLLNGLTGGALGTGLFGGDISITGGRVDAAPAGLLGSFGTQEFGGANTQTGAGVGPTGGGYSMSSNSTNSFGGGVPGVSTMNSGFNQSSMPATNAMDFFGPGAAAGPDGERAGHAGGPGAGNDGQDTGGAEGDYAEGGAVDPLDAYQPPAYRTQRRQPQNNDRAAAIGMPLSTARGWAAGTLGLPGDIEGLLRSALKAGASEGSYVDRNMSTTPTLPTSDFYKEWLPLRQEGATNRFADSAGALFGGVGATAPIRAARRAAATAAPVVRGALTDVAESMAAGRPDYVPSGQLGAVRLKGGPLSPTRTGAPGSSELVAEYMGSARTTPVENWGRTKLQKYAEVYLGTPDDPLLALEREGVSHLGPELANELSFFTAPITSERHRALTGRETRTPWERIVDFGLTPETGADYARRIPVQETAPSWIKPETKLTRGARGATNADVGFSHIADYINQATEAHHRVNGIFGGIEKARGALREGAAYGMPPEEQLLGQINLVARGLHLDPDKLDRISVPDMVRKVDTWNKYIANEAKKGTNKATLDAGIKSVLKEYPETGHQWVELSPQGLGAEGKAMGHCVGGYCSSVEDGSARILSLRDSKGQPKVTVELGRSGAVTGREEAAQRTGISREELGAMYAATGDNAPFAQWFAKNYPEAAAAPIIRQIKGPANRKPSADVIPHIQDLIRGTDIPGLEKLGDISDLHNADLFHNTGSYVTADELKALKQ
jgi:Inorganic Pyrophosphatase/PcfJ-like protein